MTTNLRKAAEMALEALEKQHNWMVANDGMFQIPSRKAINALRQALAQPVDAVNMSQERVDETAKGEHEPVACKHSRYSVDAHEQTGHCYDCGAEGRMRFVVDDAPPKRKWVGLTEEDEEQCHVEANAKYMRHKNSVRGQMISPADNWEWHFLQSISSKLKEKNT